MIWQRQLASIVLLAIWAQDTSSSSAHNPIERLQAKVSVESVDTAETSKISGHYKTSSKELVRRMGGFLDGNDLYLFPDGTFIYCEWSDIQPVIIDDKGSWAPGNGLIELKSDPEVTWKPDDDRTYIAVRRRPNHKEVLLVGIQSDLPRFEESAQDDPELTLLLSSKKREDTFNRAGAARLKASLLREAWRPEYFKKSAAGDGPSRH
jgi:hypothetical protein